MQFSDLSFFEPFLKISKLKYHKSAETNCPNKSYSRYLQSHSEFDPHQKKLCDYSYEYPLTPKQNHSYDDNLSLNNDDEYYINNHVNESDFNHKEKIKKYKSFDSGETIIQNRQKEDLNYIEAIQTKKINISNLSQGKMLFLNTGKNNTFHLKRKKSINICCENNEIRKNFKKEKSSGSAKKRELKTKSNFIKLKKCEVKDKYENFLQKKSKFSEKIYSGLLDPTSPVHSPKIKVNTSKIIRIFPFQQILPMNISVPINMTVLSLIQKIIENYLKNQNYEKNLLEFPDIVEAYELRYVDEDEGFKPDMTLEPLDHHNRFSDYYLDCAAFCKKTNADEIVKKKLNVPENTNTKNKDGRSSKSFLGKDKDAKIPIEITFTQENYSTIIEVNNNAKVKDLFKCIKLKRKSKFIINDYIILEKNKNIDEFGEKEETEEIDTNMPVKHLKSRFLNFIKKVYADDPIDIKNSTKYHTKGESVFFDENFVGKNNLSKILLNEFIAFKKEEFNAYKICKKKKLKYKVKFTVNNFKLVIDKYEGDLEKDPLEESFFFGIPNIIKLFYFIIDKKKKKDIFIEEILNIDMIESTNCDLVIKYNNDSFKKKENYMTLRFENANTTLYILAKIRFLMFKLK